MAVHNVALLGVIFVCLCLSVHAVPISYVKNLNGFWNNYNTFSVEVTHDEMHYDLSLYAINSIVVLY